MDRTLCLILIGHWMGTLKFGHISSLQLRKSLKGLVDDDYLLNSFTAAGQQELPYRGAETEPLHAQTL